MVQKRQDVGDVEIFQTERQDCLAEPQWKIVQQQPEGIAVGFDRAPADALLLDQSAAEEVMDKSIEKEVS